MAQTETLPGQQFPSFYVNTNLLDDAALIPNIGVGAYLGRNISIAADWMCAPWSSHEKRRYWKTYGGSLEARYHFGKKFCADTPYGGHHFGVFASIFTYDFQFGKTKDGVLGDKPNYAVGISYGYTIPLASRLSLRMALGIGYAWGEYKKHHLTDDHDVWASTHRLHWFGPTKAEVSLMWLIGHDNKNRKKGGTR